MSASAVSAFSPLDLSSANAAVTRAKARATASATGTTGASGTTSATGTTSTTGSTSSTSGGLTGTTAGTTFLNLLVKELQNQDPSAPMDSTAMVGQMISLNQLDQLMSINQDLGGSVSLSGTAAATSGTTTSASGTTTSGTSTTGGSTTSGKAISSSDLMAARTSLLNNTNQPTAAQAATLAASDPNSVLQLSNLSNLSNLNGVK